MKDPVQLRQSLFGLGPETEFAPRGGGFLSAIQLDLYRIPKSEDYLFSMPAVRSLVRLEFHPEVAFLVGENGSGKPTLLEVVAIRLRFNPEGGSRDHTVNTHTIHSNLHRFLTLEQR